MWNFKRGLLLTVLIAQVAEASTQSGQALTWDVSKTKIEAKLSAGFQFNEKAPNQLLTDGAVVKPSKFGPRTVTFEDLQNPMGKVTLFVCDDQKTFCERHEKQIGQGTNSGTPMSSAKSWEAGSAFWKGLERAKKSGRLVLVDFYARWCPGCVRFEQEIFGTREFKALTADLEVIKVDLDIFENQVLAEKYGVKFIPTLIVMDNQGREIDRLVDFQPMGKLSAFVRAAKEDPVPLDVLLSGGKILPTERLQKGRRLVSAGRFRPALDLLKDVSPRPREYFEALVGLSQDASKSDQRKALKDAIEAYPKSFQSIAWRTNLLELIEDPEEKKKVFSEGNALTNEWLKNPESLLRLSKEESFGEGVGFERMYVAIAQAEMAEASGLANSERVWREVAVLSDSLKIPTSKRGASMRRLVVLVQAKEFEKARRLAEALLKADPENPELQRRLLRILVELERFPAAIAIGKKALQGSYGRNEIWVAEQLVKAYLGQGQKVEAKKLLDEYLSRPEVSFPNMKSTKTNLENLRTKIN